jgi:predicted Zn finger-like uncharacterized protein
MRIACPSCRAVYNLPPALADGRRMRCARCKHEFMPSPADAVPARPAEPAAPASTPVAPVASRPSWPPPTTRPADRLQVDIGPQHPRPRPASRRHAVETALALAVSVLVLCAALAGAYIWRAELMAVWPPSQRLYALLGLA